MKRILLTIDKLNGFYEVETTFFDVVEHFHRQGWQVDIVTRLVAGTYLKRLETLQKNANIRCFTTDEHPLASEYALVWICQGYMSEALIAALQRGEISGVCLFQHYFRYADIDVPYGAALENKLAWRSLAVSTNAGAQLAYKGIDQSKLRIFPLSVSEPFCQWQQPADSTALSQILLITEEQSDEINTLRSLLQAQGIALHHISTERTLQEITPLQLAGYQLVMGQSRLLVQALAMGIPILITDGQNSSGYVNETNLDETLERHFSVEAGTAFASPSAWLTEILDGHADARRWAHAFRPDAVAQWSLTGQLHALTAALPAAKPLAISEAEATALMLHRKVITSDADNSRILERWLESRQPSATRVQVLQAFLQQVPTAGDIGVVIVDYQRDARGVEATHASVTRQFWPAKQLQICHSADELALIFAETSLGSLLVVSAGTVLLPQALLVFAEHCLRQPDVTLWYCDSISGENLVSGRTQFRPDVNLDMLRSQPYTGNQLLVNVAAARDLGGLDAHYPQLMLVDLAWKIVETTGLTQIGHISDALLHQLDSHEQWLEQPGLSAEYARIVSAHLARCGLPAKVEPGLLPVLQRVRFQHPEQPLVSVIIPTRDRLPLLRRCIESLMENTRWPAWEILLVDNGSTDADACEYLDQLAALQLAQLRVLRWPQAFNFSAINNFAAGEARGDLLLFLNNDIAVVDGEWMEEMVAQTLRPEVGIVGARLEFSDGRIQHAGIAVSVGAGVSPLYEGIAGDAGGYLLRLQSTHNVSAVSAACMMMRRAVFDELGGFSAEHFPVYLGDVDLALKARSAGYLTVWTPHARLQHMGAATRVLEEKTGVAPLPGEEVFDTFRETWGSALREDISYNKQLAKAGGNFSLGVRQAAIQQPLPGRPLPVMLACHKNITGCGQYRVMAPFKALESSAVLEGGLLLGYPSVMEVAELQPDTILLELVFEPSVAERVKQFKQVSNAKIIMEYDDYVLNLPMKSASRKKVPKDIASRLRRSVEHADWLVVSTEPLVEAYAEFHHDIRVAKNRLSVTQWEPLISGRRQGKKLRVGWAGGHTHTGDLEILLPFMKELENEVEWVFMGMRPETVKCEFHNGVPFSYYPEKLASLNLDLALVPLEQHFFNECKSNLRLLELGALGIPVICTDIEPYRCGLPVTLVQNRYKDWMNAIREHLADADALAVRGDALRSAVHQHWMLRDEGLSDWQQAWLPR